MDAGIAAMIDAQLTWLNPILRAAMIFAIAAWAISAAATGRTLGNLFPLLVRAAIVLTILASAANYTQYVQSLANNLPTEVGGMLSAPLGGTFTGAGAFDNALNQDLRAAMSCYDATPTAFKSILIWVGIVVCVAVTAWAILMAFVVWLISLIALKLCLAIGPIMISFAVFGGGPTPQWTANWLGVVASAIAAQILVIAVLVLIGFGEQQTVSNVVPGAAGANPLTELMALADMALMSGAMSIFVSQIPSLAERLFSGLAFHSAPYLRAASSVGGAAVVATQKSYRGAKKVGGFVGRSMSG